MSEFPETSPTPETSPEPSPKSRRSLWAIVALLLLVAAGATAWGWRFVQVRLAPLLSEELAKLLDRPVEVGDVEGFSLSHIRFGNSQLPATDDHPSRADIEAVDVRFNLLPLLWSRTLPLDVVLEDADVTLPQTEDGEWVTTQLSPAGEGGFVQIQLQQLRVEGGSLTVKPQPKPEFQPVSKTVGKAEPISALPNIAPPETVVLRRLTGELDLEEEGEELRFSATGYHNVKGRLNAQGSFDSEANAVQLNLSAQFLSGDVVSPWIPAPIALDDGEIFGTLKLDLDLDTPEEPPPMQGNLRFSDLDMRLGGVPEPILDGSGRMRFQNLLVGFEGISARYGEDIPLEIAQGLLSLAEGYDLPIQVPPVDWQTVSETLELEFPVPVTGEVRGQMKVVGPLETPVLVGEVETTEVAIVDRLPLTDLKARFALATATSEFVIEQLTATPAEGGGEVQAAVKVQLPQTPDAPPQVQGEFLLRNASADAIARRYELPTTAPIGSLSARGAFQSQGEQTIVQLPAVEVAGGQAQGGILLAGDRWQLELATQDVSLNSVFPQDLARTYNIGDFDGQVVLGGSYDAVSPADLEAVARGNLGVLGNAVPVEAALRQGNWETVLTAQQLVPPSSLLPPQLAAIDLGAVTGSLRVAGDARYFETPDPSLLDAATSFTTSVGGNPLRLDGQLARGVWQASVVTEGLPLSPFADVPPELTLGAFAGQAQLAGTLAALNAPSTNNVDVAAEGRLAVNGGTVQVGGAIANGQVQGQAIAENVNLTPFLPETTLAPAVFTGQAEFNAPAANFSPQTLTAIGQGGVSFDGGGVAATFELADGRWQVDAEQLSIPLDPFVDAPVALSPLVKIGEVARLSGSLTDLRPAAVSGQLQVGFRFGEGATEPLAAGKSPQRCDPAPSRGARECAPREAVEAALAETGIVALDVTLAGDRWQATANLQNAALSELVPQLTPAATPNLSGRLAGAVALSGGWDGFAPTNLALQEGALQIAELQVGDRAYDPLIAGPLVANEEGVFAQLLGQTETDSDTPDGLAFALTPDLQPREFALQLDETTAIGVQEEDLWRVELANLPLGLFGVRPVGDRGILEGSLDARLTADLTQQWVEGAAQVSDPRLGLTRADNLEGAFIWENNLLQLPDLTLVQGESRYAFNGTLTTTDDPRVSGEIAVEQGQIQRVLEALRWFDFNDIQRGFAAAEYGDADDLDAVGVGMPEAPLMQQIRRFVEIRELLDQQDRLQDEASPLPQLANLQGTFSGTATVSGALSEGVDFTFDFLGEDWTWEDYRIREVEARGSYEDELWDVQTARVRANLNAPIDTDIAFDGIIGGREQSGQFQLVGLPVSVLSEFVTVPPEVRLGGSFDAEAVLSGSFENPATRGTVFWNDGRINEQDVTQAVLGFEFNNARLNFGGDVVLVESEPIALQASLPFQFPGSTVRPQGNDFEINVSVANEGLAVLTALSGGNVQWLGGEGSLALTVTGERLGSGFNYLPLSTTGEATFSDAAFNSPQLPEPLTQVNGTVEFRDNTIAVPELVGQFRQGSVRVSGELPLLSPIPVEEPLRVAFDRVGLTLKGLYRGTIDGTVDVTNSALYPELDGELRLSDGQILIPDPATASSIPTRDVEALPAIRYDDLALELGRGIQIVSAPVLNFVATGTLTLNGAFDNPEPRGTIFLEDGQVNLFTTTFTLARGENTATFSPQFGRDPLLDVRLRAAVQETTRPRIVSPVGFNEIGSRSEIQESAIERGAVETIRIEANVEGLASRLFENLELSSSPGRSETEIYSLIGGGALSNFGQQDTSLVVASSAVLTQVQSILGRALGYRDFRLFPAIDPRTSSLGLGAEVGVNLTENFSASVLTILDRDDSTRFGIRYRIDDNWLIRGSTDFDDDNRGVLEYQLRF